MKRRKQKHKKQSRRVPGTFARPQRATNPPGTVTLRAISFESVAARKPLRFAVPRQEAYTNNEAPIYFWALIQYGFPLISDPTAFPAIPGGFTLTSDERVRMERYLETTKRLAQSVVLNADISMTVSIPDREGPEIVETTFTAADVEAGFAVLFRQLYSDEAAGFKNIHGLLIQKLKGSAPHFEELRAWGATAGTLKSKSAARVAIEQLASNGEGPSDLDGYPDHRPPSQSISHYLYGDHIHWGEHREVVEGYAENPFTDAIERMAFLNATAGLAHLYIGFSVIVEAALAA